MNTSPVNNAMKSTGPPPRRSSFFERRSIVLEPSMNVDLDESKGGEGDEDLYQYYEQLLSEKSQWKKEVQNRRGNLQDAELQLKIAKKSDKIPIDYSILSKEDIEFLQDKPDLPELVESVKQLQKSTMETYALYKKMTELDDVILRDAEEKVERVREFLLKD